ncbi:hypothetical protein WJX79_006698 [Trebouxia sp. C0005]
MGGLHECKQRQATGVSLRPFLPKQGQFSTPPDPSLTAKIPPHSSLDCESATHRWSRAATQADVLALSRLPIPPIMCLLAVPQQRNGA